MVMTRYIWYQNCRKPRSLLRKVIICLPKDWDLRDYITINFMSKKLKVKCKETKNTSFLYAPIATSANLCMRWLKHNLFTLLLIKEPLREPMHSHSTMIFRARGNIIGSYLQGKDAHPHSRITSGKAILRYRVLEKEQGPRL